MIMKHPDDNKIYKSEDSINWEIATIDDVYDKLTKTKKDVIDVTLENEKLKKQLKIAKKYLSLIKRNVSVGSLAYTYVENAKTEIEELDK